DHQPLAAAHLERGAPHRHDHRLVGLVLNGCAIDAQQCRTAHEPFLPRSSGIDNCCQVKAVFTVPTEFMKPASMPTPCGVVSNVTPASCLTISPGAVPDLSALI